MIDIVRELGAAQREVGERPGPAGSPIRSVRLQRDFDAPIEDVWDALTNPGRIGRWFLPVSGDFRLGGRYQFEGNAGGEIVTCERPSRLKVTWFYGAAEPHAISEVEIKLSRVAEGQTHFDFLHAATVPEERWAEYGPGAVGAGWDGGLLGLSLHLRTGATVEDPEAWQVSEEGRAFYARSSEAWGAANRASGADPEVAARGVANTTAFYTTVPDGAPEAEPDS
jgi:uncharacterized protein YndB with AHSA1/START domain